MSNYTLRQALQMCRDYLSCIPESSAGGDDEAVRMARIAKDALAQTDDKAQPVAYYTDIPGHRVYAEKPHDFDEDGLTFKFDGVIYRYEDYWTPLYAAPQPPAEQPFQPDWMNYKQGVADGKAEARLGAELSDSELYKMACLSLGNVPAARYRKDLIGLMREGIAADRAARGGSA